jgi:hypothetical protein
MARNRHDGWTEQRQRAFIQALAVVGTVNEAAKMAGISRKSAYQLRGRSDAKDFARAWDIAICQGRDRVFDYMIDRAINGVTTFTLKLGGAIEVKNGLDGHLMAAHLKAPVSTSIPAAKGDKR